MSVITLNNDNFDNEVMKSDKPVLVDFFAVWCGPCQMVSPIVDKLAEESTDYKFCKVNVDDCPELARKFGVSYIPMLMVVNKGEVKSKETGAKSAEEILAMLQKA